MKQTTVILAGMSHEALVLARELGIAVLAVTDPKGSPGHWQGLPVYDDDAHALRRVKADGVALAIDHPGTRAKVAAKIAEARGRLIDLVGSTLGPGTIHREGLYVQKGCLLSTDGRFGEGVRINTGATIMADVTLGDFVTIAPRAVLMNDVTIFPQTHVGANATILPGVTIGKGCIVAAGAVVTRDCPDGVILKGNPAVWDR